MVEKRRFLDIWIVESNTVYKEVPFEVVTDWLGQGRLLEDDMFKPSGTREWFRFGGHHEFEPYLPKPEPNRTEDKAEALEPVEVSFSFTRPKEDEDEDVDMIPLIDVSLVLLVFFMLTASVATVAAAVRTPDVEHTITKDSPSAIRIDIANNDGIPAYAFGVADKPSTKAAANLGVMLGLLKQELDQLPPGEKVEVVINADRDIAARHVRDVLIALRADQFRNKISRNYFGATQRNP
jgi:biopolymer transport protein ExbD